MATEISLIFSTVSAGVLQPAMTSISFMRSAGLKKAQGIAIRVGHHCAQPVHRHFGVYASNRASSGIYNSVEDAQALIEALGKVRPFFGVE